MMDDMPQQGWTALIVAHDELMREFLTRNLFNAGMRPRAVASVDGASALLATEQFDTVLLHAGDNVTAELQLCSIVRETHGNSVVIVVLLTHSYDQLCLQALKLGADDCIQSPFHTEELIARIYVHLRRRGLTYG